MLIYDPRCKRIGSYLIDAGLLTPDQVDVILMDQKASHLKFGEIAAMRGWVAAETIEFIYTKVIEPERVIGSPLKLDRLPYSLFPSVI
ncbi:MAG: hypothetical protein HC810_06545 [Acaryochloridaceae cyanobacterium RL_2_7]|nr:hypothetical protein [Acaryochloridaceae cyanobacterium RL_2_7]